MNDNFSLAKEWLPVRTAVERYCGVTVPPHGRVPCPLHRGQHRSFAVYDKSWRCYSKCGTGGDVINFVQRLFGYGSPIEALRRLNNDFRLGLEIDGSRSASDFDKARYRQEKRERELFAWREHQLETISGIRIARAVAHTDNHAVTKWLDVREAALLECQTPLEINQFKRRHGSLPT